MTTIHDLTDWKQHHPDGSDQWLLLGKGPTFSRLDEVPVEQYRVCTLNHVIRQVPASIAHIIDIDVVADCADALLNNATSVVMPYHPHENHSCSPRTLWDYCSDIPVLAQLAEQGKLYGYNLSTSKKRHGSSPVIAVQYFSAEAALNVLVALNASRVRSLGVDGGSQYAGSFSDLDDKTRLANGRSSFDAQFTSIAKTLMHSGIDYAPWYIDAPVRVFVGTDAAQMAGVKVLEYSIKKHAGISVTVEAIDDADIPVPVDPHNRSRTGFSFSRFKIPSLCNYQGRGIYLDADMLVFTDITRLWTTDMQGNHVISSAQEGEDGRIPQYSVMLLDNTALDWDVKAIVAGLDNQQYNYAELMQKLCIVPPDKVDALLPEAWNSLEKYVPGETCLIHYTDMPTQPWVSPDNPNGQLWYAAAREAVDTGFISADFIYDEVARGNVSPDLPGWLDMPAPANHAALVRNWTPPFKRFAGATAAARKKAAGKPVAQATVSDARPSRFARVKDRLVRQSPRLLKETCRKARGLIRGY